MSQTDFEFGRNDPNWKTHDPPTYRQACMGMMVCPHCGRALMCGDVGTDSTVPAHREFHQPTEQEMDNMDLKSHRSKDRKQGGKFARRPFMKAKDIPKNGLSCVVIEFRTAPKQMEYSDFLMDVKAGSKEYTVGLRSQSVLLDMIMDELGTNTDKYNGKKIKFVKGGSKGQYINVG